MELYRIYRKAVLMLHQLEWGWTDPNLRHAQGLEWALSSACESFSDVEEWEGTSDDVMTVTWEDEIDPPDPWFDHAWAVAEAVGDDRGMLIYGLTGDDAAFFLKDLYVYTMKKGIVMGCRAGVGWERIEGTERWRPTYCNQPTEGTERYCPHHLAERHAADAEQQEYDAAAARAAERAGEEVWTTYPDPFGEPGEQYHERFVDITGAPFSPSIVLEDVVRDVLWERRHGAYGRGWIEGTADAIVAELERRGFTVTSTVLDAAAALAAERAERDEQRWEAVHSEPAKEPEQ
jgi:hypothetical protein